MKATRVCAHVCVSGVGSLNENKMHNEMFRKVNSTDLSPSLPLSLSLIWVHLLVKIRQAVKKMYI